MPTVTTVTEPSEYPALKSGMRIQHFFSMDPDPAQLEKNPDPTLNRNKEKNIFIFLDR